MLGTRLRRILSWTVVVGAGVLAACGPVPTSPSARDVASEIGLARTISTQGDNCWADFTGDGADDLVLLNHGHVDGAQLMVDDGVRFVLRYSFKKVGPAGNSWDWHSCAPADFNRDGRMDVYMGAGGCAGTCPSYPKSLYLQNADGSFTDVAAAWGVTEPTGRGRDSEAFDVNQDGYPDLFVGNEMPVSYPTPNRLFLNVGGAGMVDATATYGLPTTEVGGLCVETGDYNGDGFTDVLVCGQSRTYLYRNAGGVGFVESAAAAGITPTRVLKDAAFEDVDGDGDLDLTQQTWSNVIVRINSGGGAFGGDAYKLGTGNGGHDLGTGDADGDGDVDFFAVVAKANGATTNPPDFLMLNNGDGRSFTRLATLQVTEGNGDTATIKPRWRGSTGSLIVVNNGLPGQGPRQAIEVTVL